MQVFKLFGTEIFSYGKSTSATLQKEEGGQPLQSGRSTVPEFNEGFLAQLQAGGIVEPDFDVSILKALKYLACYNHDVSYAVENFVTLANTDFNIEFADGISDELQVEVIQHLNSKYKCWYNYADGLNSLLNDIFTQLSITGCISGEFVVAPDLGTIDQIILVDPINIRFIYDQEIENWKPVQQVGQLGLQRDTIDGHIELNPNTYRYIASRRFGESPYALPPFMSALESILVQKDMLANLKVVMKKYGMLGFMSVMLKAPPRGAAEADDAYNARLTTYLGETAKQLDKGLVNGAVFGFEGQHDITHTEVKGDAKGASGIYNMNEQNLMAGLKTPPEMLGRQFNTSETFGRVLLAKFTQQIVNMQKTCGSFLADGFNLELKLAGLTVEDIIKSIIFDKPMLGDESRLQDAMSKKIDNNDKLYKQGVISQQTRAQRLSIDEPDQEEPRQEVTAEGNEDDNDNSSSSNPSNDDDATDGKTTEKNQIQKFNKANKLDRQAYIEHYAKRLGYGTKELTNTCDC